MNYGEIDPPKTLEMTIVCRVDAAVYARWLADMDNGHASEREYFEARLDEVYSDGGEVLTGLRVEAVEVLDSSWVDSGNV